MNSERKTNAAEVSDNDLDPFTELEINIVEDLAKETSGTDMVSIKETLAGCFDPPICHQLPENWEHSFFQQVGKVGMNVENNDNDANLDNEVQELTSAVPKMNSYREAISCLEDVLCFLESKGNSDTASVLSRVISHAQSDWLKCRRSQTKVSDSFSKL